MIQARLKLEIIVGYLIWVSFFVWIVYIIHDSRQKKSAMDRQEAHWQGERQATNRAFLGLLDLASTGELIADWTEEEAKAKAEAASPLMNEAREMLVKWEAGDPEVRALWTKMNNWVYEGFDETYRKMGVGFDKIYYESNTYLEGKEKVMEGLEKGFFYKKEDGSVWADLTPEGLDHKL